MTDQKYHYLTAAESPGLMPRISLIPGRNGVIKCVDLYPDEDYIRGEGFSLGMVSAPVQKAIGGPYDPSISFVHSLKDGQLLALSRASFVKEEVQFPHEELLLIRELELSLSAQSGNYRG